MTPKPIVALPQEELVVDEIKYFVTAMPATVGIKFIEQYHKDIDEGKSNLLVMKSVICKHVDKNSMSITEELFDIIFARKFGHLQKLYAEVLKYNFPEFFQGADSEE